jgi:hypothetical protein
MKLMNGLWTVWFECRGDQDCSEIACTIESIPGFSSKRLYFSFIKNKHILFAEKQIEPYLWPYSSHFSSVTIIESYFT